MDYATCRSLPAMFFEAAERRGDRPFLWAKRDGPTGRFRWSEATEQVMRLARGLLSLGVAPGDRVALVAESRPEWVIADLAIMSIGAVTVPAYTTNTVEDHRHVLGNSGARAAIVSTPALAARADPGGRAGPERAGGRRDRAARRGKHVLGRAAFLGARCSPTPGAPPQTMCAPVSRSCPRRIRRA